jgi:hypothetical protein
MGNKEIDKKADRRLITTKYGINYGSTISEMYSQVHGAIVIPKTELNNPIPTKIRNVPALLEVS